MKILPKPGNLAEKQAVWLVWSHSLNHSLSFHVVTGSVVALRKWDTEVLQSLPCERHIFILKGNVITLAWFSSFILLLVCDFKNVICFNCGSLIYNECSGPKQRQTETNIMTHSPQLSFCLDYLSCITLKKPRSDIKFLNIP